MEDLKAQILKAQIEKLRREINLHDVAYYQKAKPLISDYDYDRLYKELLELEKKYPQYFDSNSPTQRIGDKALEHFQSVKHNVKMLSLDNSYAKTDLIERFQRWQKKLGKNWELLVEPKIDGVAISLNYQNGRLIHAATRGDGVSGDDVSANVRSITSLPLVLPDCPFAELELRGEIFMSLQGFETMNAKRERENLEKFANPRNATAGALKQLDPRIAAERPLRIAIHSLALIKENPKVPKNIEDMRNFYEFLVKNNLPISRLPIFCKTLDDLFAAISSIDDERVGYDFATDGAVIKVNDFAAQKLLGETSKAPRWAFAFKYPPEQAKTRLLDVKAQVGKSGALTPVAILEPIFISGTKVSRASLHNESFLTNFRQKNARGESELAEIRIGDTVVVSKAGEIIPQIVGVDLKKRLGDSRSFNLGESLNWSCPSCASRIVRQELANKAEGVTRTIVTYYCQNPACPAQAAAKLTHFASRKALDIDMLGESVAKKLLAKGLVRMPTDCFGLQKNQLESLLLDSADLGKKRSKERRFGQRRAIALLKSLERAKSAPLSRFLYALAIPQVGLVTAEELSRLHADVFEVADSEILRILSAFEPAKSAQAKAEHPLLSKLVISPELGVVAAKSVLAFFTADYGRKILADCRKFEIKASSNNFYKNAPSAKQKTLAGATFVITGKLSRPRAEIAVEIKAEGGKVLSAISKNCDYLLAGEDGGSKLAKAEKLGIQIIDELEFRELIAGRNTLEEPLDERTKFEEEAVQEDISQGNLF